MCYIHKEMKYLVVGGHGFIGSHLCKEMRERGFDFDIYDKNIPNGSPLNSIVKQRRKGLDDSISYDSLDGRFYDTVIHLGSYAGIRSSLPTQDYFSNNVYDLQVLLSKLNFYKVVYISSSSVLGNVETPYSLSKKIAESIIKKEKDSLIIRPFTVYGEYGRPEMFITKVVNREKIIVNGNPSEIIRNFTYVGDLVNVIIENLGEVGALNVIGEKEYSLLDVLNIFNLDFSVTDADPRDFTSHKYNELDINKYTKTNIEDFSKKMRGL